MNIRQTIMAVAIASTTLVGGAANASTNFDWTFTNTANGVVEGQGTLTTGAANGLGFDVTALTGSLNDPTVGVSGAISNFNPGAGDDGIFAWDNVVYTTPGNAHLDNLGLLFDVGGQEINIYNATGGCCSVVYPGVYPNGDVAAGSSNNFGGDQGTFNLTAVPEPATWAMFLVGFGALGFTMRASRRKQTGALVTA